MKRIIAGSAFLVSGSVLLAACKLCVSLEGVVPSDIRGEQILAWVFLLTGLTLMAWEALGKKQKTTEV